MSNYWLRRIGQNPDNPALIGEALLAFEALADEYAARIDVKGRPLIGVAADIPDLSIKVHTHWSEIGAIFDITKLRRQTAMGKARRHYMEVHPRALNATQVEKYAEVRPEVIGWDELLIEIDFVRAQWEAVSKGLERLHQQLRIITEMRSHGNEAATI